MAGQLHTPSCLAGAAYSINEQAEQTATLSESAVKQHQQVCQCRGHLRHAVLGTRSFHPQPFVVIDQRALLESSTLKAIAACTGTEQRTPADNLLHEASSKTDSIPDSVPEKVRFDGRAFRRSLGKTGRYVRNPVNDKDSLALMENHGVGYSTTGLVAQMRESGNTWQYKGLTIKLAKSYGYCWGVERAVQMAYEARRAYPGQKLYVTNEIIHNPAVNQVSNAIRQFHAYMFTNLTHLLTFCANTLVFSPVQSLYISSWGGCSCSIGTCRRSDVVGVMLCTNCWL